MNKGISIIEILIVIALIIIALTCLLDLVTYSLKISTSIKETFIANNLAQEAMEAVRNFRDGTDWDTDGLRDYILGAATSSDPYHPELDTAFSPPKWRLTADAETINSYTRKVVFEKVSRDTNDNIEEIYNPDNDDSNTRKVIVTVSWQDKEVKLVTYLTNWKE